MSPKIDVSWEYRLKYNIAGVTPAPNSILPNNELHQIYASARGLALPFEMAWASWALKWYIVAVPATQALHCEWMRQAKRDRTMLYHFVHKITIGGMAISKMIIALLVVENIKTIIIICRITINISYHCFDEASLFCDITSRVIEADGRHGAYFRSSERDNANYYKMLAWYSS